MVECKIEKIIVQNYYLWIWYEACRKCMLIYSVDVHCTCVKNTCVQICAWFVSAPWSAMTQTDCSCRWFEHNQFKSQIHIWVSVNFISNRWFNNNGFSMHMEMMNDCKLYYSHPHSMSCTHTDWNGIDLICSGTCFSRNMNFPSWTFVEPTSEHTFMDWHNFRTETLICMWLNFMHLLSIIWKDMFSMDNCISLWHFTKYTDWDDDVWMFHIDFIMRKKCMNICLQLMPHQDIYLAHSRVFHC